MLQRAVEEEVTAFLGRARSERTPEARGSRNGNRPRQVLGGWDAALVDLKLRKVVGEEGHYLNPGSSSEHRSRLVESLREERSRLDDLARMFPSCTRQQGPHSPRQLQALVGVQAGAELVVIAPRVIGDTTPSRSAPGSRPITLQQPVQ